MAANGLYFSVFNIGADAGGTYLSVHTANVTLLMCMRLCFHITNGAGALLIILSILLPSINNMLTHYLARWLGKRKGHDIISCTWCIRATYNLRLIPWLVNLPVKAMLLKCPEAVFCSFRDGTNCFNRTKPYENCIYGLCWSLKISVVQKTVIFFSSTAQYSMS